MREHSEQKQDRSNAFENSPISRRQFIRLSATAAGAVTLPGQALAEVSSSKLTDEYQYAINHTEEREAIPTLVTFSETSGLDQISNLDLPLNARTTTEPTVAAHAYLTTDQVEQVLEIESVTKFQFSPGSNPFWLLDHYPQGVFPSPEDSVDFIDYEQLSQGMEYLEKQYPSQLHFQSIGHSPGHYNFLTEEEDPKDIWVVEVTNDISDEDRFQEKEKLVFSLSIHADERGGVEAGTRFIEDVLTGNESTVKGLLDEFVLIFVYANSDGWVARDTQYNDRSEGYSRYTAGTTRFSNEAIDPNRNYPTIGWIDGTHYPAEPNGLNLEDDAPGIDQDVGADYTDNVIDALWIVEHLRGYDNLAYGVDLHGMYSSEWMIEGATVNKQYSYEEITDVHEYSDTLSERLDENVRPLLEENDELFNGLQTEDFFGEDATIPEAPFSYGTNNDVLDYGVTGYIASWMGDPEDQGGLGMNVMLFEMAFNNTPTPTTFAVPDDFEVSDLVNVWVSGFTTIIRTLVEHASEDMKSALVTNHRSTAVVMTDSLMRSSDQLEFVEQDELEVSSIEDGLLTGSITDEDGDLTVETPDPEEILGYEQRAYEVTPFEIFEDLKNHIADGSEQFVGISIDDVCEGILTSNDGQVMYDNLIIIHGGEVTTSAYIDAIDEYIEAGGNLVLTDTAVRLLGALENELADEITSEDLSVIYTDFPNIEEENYPHQLLTDTRPYQDQLWRNSPLGYGVPRRGSESEIPMPVIDSDTFAAAGGEVAATTNDQVAVGSILSDMDTEVGIKVISTLLPPARQDHLHPFGMADHAISFLGLVILTNALGYSHHWYVNDELVRKIGAAESKTEKNGSV